MSVGRRTQIPQRKERAQDCERIVVVSYICGGAMRSRTSVPLCSLKFFFLAVKTVVAGGLSRTQFSFSPSIPIAPLESSCKFDFGRFPPSTFAVCTAAPELATEVMGRFPVR